jgi:hypothetical protein
VVVAVGLVAGVRMSALSRDSEKHWTGGDPDVEFTHEPNLLTRRTCS